MGAITRSNRLIGACLPLIFDEFDGIDPHLGRCAVGKAIPCRRKRHVGTDLNRLAVDTYQVLNAQHEVGTAQGRLLVTGHKLVEISLGDVRDVSLVLLDLMHAQGRFQ